MMTKAQTRTIGGAKVTLNEMPSEEAASPARPAAIDVTDASGRTITLRKPDVLAQFQLIEAVGDTATNRVYMAMVTPLIFVSAIDGAPVGRPGTKDEIEALIKRLDEDGIAAVIKGVQEAFGESLAGDDAKNG
jgi:hypothetical protein